MHTNILNKVLAALTGLLLCTESAVAQVQGENGYWKFRDATVFGVSNGTEEGADSLGNVQADIRRLGMLLFVYPGADSILVHRGSKETRRTFKIN